MGIVFQEVVSQVAGIPQSKHIREENCDNAWFYLYSYHNINIGENREYNSIFVSRNHRKKNVIKTHDKI